MSGKRAVQDWDAVNKQKSPKADLGSYRDGIRIRVSNKAKDNRNLFVVYVKTDDIKRVAPDLDLVDALFKVNVDLLVGAGVVLEGKEEIKTGDGKKLYDAKDPAWSFEIYSRKGLADLRASLNTHIAPAKLATNTAGHWHVTDPVWLLRTDGFEVSLIGPTQPCNSLLYSLVNNADEHGRYDTDKRAFVFPGRDEDDVQYYTNSLTALATKVGAELQIWCSRLKVLSMSQLSMKLSMSRVVEHEHEHTHIDMDICMQSMQTHPRVCLCQNTRPVETDPAELVKCQQLMPPNVNAKLVSTSYAVPPTCHELIELVLEAFAAMGATAAELVIERRRLYTEPVYYDTWCTQIGSWYGGWRHELDRMRREFWYEQEDP